ncbi:MAG: hypothetical protein WAU82_07205 [Candidatus Binatus sp.]|uniref:hypothetical protein n=1 Tax=Candidatus Binatus sp. TaxID=2811406 RepID=UPI003BB057A1
MRTRAYRKAVVAMLSVALAVRATSARALPYSDFFTPANPQHLSLTLFASAIGNESLYAATHEGFQLEQTLNPYIGVVGRVSGYQIYQGAGWDNPLLDHPKTRPRNFGVFMGGIDLLPFQGTSLTVLGGRDVGDSTGARIEGDFSSWILLHSRHPINLSFIGDHFYNNGQTSGMIDVRVVMSSWRDVTWLLGAGGQLWGGGQEPHVMKEFGPDLGLFFRQWQTSLDFQAGYGNNHGYGTIAITRHFGWDE